jgi:hypothetical protein
MVTPNFCADIVVKSLTLMPIIVVIEGNGCPDLLAQPLNEKCHKCLNSFDGKIN